MTSWQHLTACDRSQTQPRMVGGAEMISIRPLLVSAVVLDLSTAVAAASASPTGYGFRTGVAAARIHGSYGDVVGSERRIGLAWAWYARKPVGRWVSLQPELGWVSKGAEGDLAITSTVT